MAVTGGIHHYGVGPTTGRTGKRTGRKNADPEHQLQVAVVQYLTFALPADYLWTADAAGVRVGMQTAVKMKAAGVRRGWPDIRILFPSAVTRYIELKAGQGLSPEQRAFRDYCGATGRDIWAVCRTVDEVAEALTRWKVPVKMGVSAAHRYAT